MVTLSGITTKGGDSGQASLGDGQRIAKNSLRIVAIGAVDEANACIGLAQVAARDEGIADRLLTITHDLFDVGADLCLPQSDTAEIVLRISTDHLARLETAIAMDNADLPPLRSFVLPGGNESAARLHHARTVVRRAELAIWALAEHEAINPLVPQYLNRLSDWLFIAARLVTQEKGDLLWQPAFSVSQ